MKNSIRYLILISIFGFQGCDLHSELEYSRNPIQNTRFYLYTPRNKNHPTVLPIYNRSRLISSNFNSKFPTRVVIHGFNVRVDANFFPRIIEAYLKKGRFNVIVVDWHQGAMNALKDYPVAVNNSYLAGSVVAKFLDFLSDEGNISLSSVYLIGYSLGAHVAGFAGRLVKTGRISTIFGLDPAGPLFQLNSPDKRLASSDADYVEIIHTHVMYLGILAPIGDADFYANDGRNQPGCYTIFSMCPHRRAYEIFAKSIVRKAGFRAGKCGNVREILHDGKCSEDNEVYLVGGEPARSNRRGIFKFNTAVLYPFVNDRTNVDLLRL